MYTKIHPAILLLGGYKMNDMRYDAEYKNLLERVELCCPIQ